MKNGCMIGTVLKKKGITRHQRGATAQTKHCDVGHGDGVDNEEEEKEKKAKRGVSRSFTCSA